MIKTFNSTSQEKPSQFLVRNIREIFVFRFALANFVVNGLRTRYRRSVLGFLWSLLNPLLIMIVISVVFSTVFKQDIQVYAVYIFSGLSPWLYISASIAGGCLCLINAEGFLKKVYVPKSIFPVVLESIETVNFLLSLVSLYILSLALGHPLTLSLLLLPFAVIITFIFNLGLATSVGIATIYFRDTNHITGILLQALFYMTPIVYPEETIPQAMRGLYLYNPFYYFINLFRKIILGKPELNFADWLIPLGIALFTFFLGSLILKKTENDLVFRL
jgi:ABC-2 type transport system permease protein/lipopolysaccharide transport system permease protein